MPTHGGLFNGGWEADLDGMTIDLVGAVSDALLDTWKDNLEQAIKVNTGRYMRQPRVTRLSDTRASVNDDAFVYGPWLEGTGSRNSPVTRFKGYGSAESALEKVQASIDEIGAPVVAKFVEGLGR